MKFGNADVPLRREAAGEAHRAGHAITVGVRPEDMELVGAGQGLPTVINLVESLGADAYVYGVCDPRRHRAPHHRASGRPPTHGEGRDRRVRAEAGPRAPVLHRHRRTTAVLTRLVSIGRRQEWPRI
jgi:ABC-type sugar transport system ATPase subunit